MSKKRFLVTAALPYANGPVHIGHLAGCYLPADIYVRYLRAKGEDVLFVCGSDEHGVAITMKARKEGITPQQVVDKYHAIIRDSFEQMGISFDIYSRTTKEIHKETSQEFFRNLYDKGIFQETETEQYYDEKAQQFLADRYILGTCPVCGNPNAYGDQCEKCGTSLSPMELKDVRSALSGDKPVLRKTKNWFLPMDKLAESPEFLEYKKRVDGWKVNVKGQFNSWLNQGLQPRSMTRDLDWGVPVPIKGAEGKVLYVWFDAPIGYISATKEYFINKGNKDDWKLWWQDKDTDLIHFIGKDNIVFHTLIFPMILLAHGNYVVPANVPANEFLNLEGDKISTSRDHAIWLHEYLQDFPGREDELRYVLTSIAPETKDSDFTWKDYQLKVNSELVAILGNFVNRVAVLTHKFFGGKVHPPADYSNIDKYSKWHKIYIDNISQLISTASNIDNLLSKFEIREAQAELINIARLGNKYLAEMEPWKLIKEDEEYTKFVLWYATRICAELARWSVPFLPKTAEKIRQQFNFDPKVLQWTVQVKAINGENHTIKQSEDGQIMSFESLTDIDPINPAEHLFKPIEDAQIEAQLAKLAAKKEATQPAALETTVKPAKPEIVYEDFAKMDIRVGTVLEAERVPKTDKLMKLTIDTGLDVRTVVSGIAHCFEPDEVKGRQVCLLANLAPRKLKGIDSQGMILMAEDADGKLKFVAPADVVKNGSTVS